MAEGNFGFIENINADVYSKLHNAEKRLELISEAVVMIPEKHLQKLLKVLLYTTG